MRFPAVAALQPALLALLALLITIVLAVAAARYWRGPRRTGKPPRQPVPARATSKSRPK
jgi:peptidoglycan/LPS O-acetylase OafA/YrhL